MLKQVHSGIHKATKQPVALKFISKARKTLEEIAAIKREIKLHRGLHHPHIVELWDAFETDKDFCLVTELARGTVLFLQEYCRLDDT